MSNLMRHMRRQKFRKTLIKFKRGELKAKDGSTVKTPQEAIKIAHALAWGLNNATDV